MKADCYMGKAKGCVSNSRAQMSMLYAIVSFVALLSLALAGAPSSAYAYYNRGVVTISPGTSYVSLTAGESMSVSVYLDPSADSQLPGCGMQECPQECPPECFDANGQCVCGGTTYSTYYPTVTCSSSNSGVATASYSAGVITVYSYAEGSADINLTASLRQFSDGYSFIHVDVAPAPYIEPETPDVPETPEVPSGAASDSGSDASGSSPASIIPTAGGSASTTPSSTKPTIVPSTETTGTDTASAQSVAGAGVKPQSGVSVSGTGEVATRTATAESNVIVESSEGKVIHIVQLGVGESVADVLAAIVGTTDEATFWAGVASDRPSYSWNFAGNDFPNGGKTNLNLDVAIGNAADKGVVKALENQAGHLVFSCAENGSIPGHPTFYIRADDAFPDGTGVALYRYDKEKGELVLTDISVRIEGGYAIMSLEEGGTYAVSSEDLNGVAIQAIEGSDMPAGANIVAGGTVQVAGHQADSTVPIVVTAAIALVAVVGGVFLRRYLYPAKASVSSSSAQENASQAKPGDDA